MHAFRNRQLCATRAASTAGTTPLPLLTVQGCRMRRVDLSWPTIPRSSLDQERFLILLSIVAALPHLSGDESARAWHFVPHYCCSADYLLATASTSSCPLSALWIVNRPREAPWIPLPCFFRFVSISSFLLEHHPILTNIHWRIADDFSGNLALFFVSTTWLSIRIDNICTRVVDRSSCLAILHYIETTLHGFLG